MSAVYLVVCVAPGRRSKRTEAVRATDSDEELHLEMEEPEGGPAPLQAESPPTTLALAAVLPTHPLSTAPTPLPPPLPLSAAVTLLPTLLPLSTAPAALLPLPEPLLHSPVVTDSGAGNLEPLPVPPPTTPAGDCRLHHANVGLQQTPKVQQKLKRKPADSSVQTVSPQAAGPFSDTGTRTPLLAASMLQFVPAAPS